MTMRVFSSFRFERIFARLAESLAQECASADPFYTPTIWVAHAEMQTWLSQQLAQCRGIAMLTHMQLFDPGIWGELSTHYTCEHSTPSPIMLRRECLQWLIFYALQKHADAPALHPVQSYLATVGGNAWRAYWQLADTLSRLFRGYENDIPEKLAAWVSGEPEAEPLAACQAALYELIFRPGGLRDAWSAKQACPVLTLRELLAGITDFHLQTTVAPIHVFGISTIAPTQQHALARIAQNRPIYFYRLEIPEHQSDTTHPASQWNVPLSLAYGSLLETMEVLSLDKGTPTHIQGDALYDIATYQEACAHTGGESPLVLSEAASFIHEPSSAKTTSATPSSLSPEAASDTSACKNNSKKNMELHAASACIQMVACPSIWQEVEAVRTAVARRLAADPTLSPDDIAMIVPDMGRYRPVIEAVFGSEPQRFRFFFTDRAGGGESRYAEAVRDMFSVISEGMTRKNICDLIGNPCFLAGRMEHGQALEFWAQRAEALHIYRGYSDADEGVISAATNKASSEHAAQCRHTPYAKVHTWAHGLERLRLGRIMTGEGDPDTAGDEHFHLRLPFAQSGDDSHTEALLMQALDALAHLAATCRHQDKTPDGWAKEVHGWCETFLGIPEDKPDEETVRRILYDSLYDMESLDTLSPSGDWTVPCEAMRPALDASLVGVPVRRGRFLGGSVHVLEAGVDRIPPFRMIFCCGMEEGSFPRKSFPTSLDVTHDSPNLFRFDVATADRLAMLQYFLQTRDSLILSWVSRNLEKDEAYQPGSLVVAFQEWLDRCAGKSVFAPVHLPLMPESSAYAFPTPIARRCDAWGTDIPSIATARRVAITGKSIARPFVDPPESQNSQDTNTSITLTPKLVQTFLSDPVIAYARERLRLTSWEEEPHDTAEDAPRTLGRKAHDMREKILTSTWGTFSTHPPFAEALQEQLAAHIPVWNMSGDMPESFFGKHAHKELAATFDRLQQGGGKMPGLHHFNDLLARAHFFSPITICATVSASSPCSASASVSQTSSSASFMPSLSPMMHIYGEAAQVFYDPKEKNWWQLANALSTSCHSTNVLSNMPTRACLKAWATYLCLRAAHVVADDTLLIGDSGWHVLVLGRDGVAAWTFPALDEETARSWLSHMHATLLHASLPGHLPWRLIMQKSMPDFRQNDISPEMYAEALRMCIADEGADDRWNDLTNELIHLLQPSVPDDALSLVRERFDLFAKGTSLDMEP